MKIFSHIKAYDQTRGVGIYFTDEEAARLRQSSGGCDRWRISYDDGIVRVVPDPKGVRMVPHQGRARIVQSLKMAHENRPPEIGTSAPKDIQWKADGELVLLVEPTPINRAFAAGPATKKKMGIKRAEKRMRSSRAAPSPQQSVPTGRTATDFHVERLRRAVRKINILQTEIGTVQLSVAPDGMLKAAMTQSIEIA